MTKVLCKIIFTPEGTHQQIELFGQIDNYQLISQDSEWITVESTYYLNNQLYIKESIIYKQDISNIIIYKENKHYIIDKENLALNTHVLSFVGMET